MSSNIETMKHLKIKVKKTYFGNMRTNGVAPLVSASMVVSTWGKANLCLNNIIFRELENN